MSSKIGDPMCELSTSWKAIPGYDKNPNDRSFIPITGKIALTPDTLNPSLSTFIEGAGTGWADNRHFSIL